MLRTKSQVITEIKAGKRLLLAGDEKLLMELPQGKWIGGTIPYFMGEKGGVVTDEMIYVTELPAFAEYRSIKWYDAETLERIPADAPENGFTFLIIPATSKAHVTYAQEAPEYENLFLKPILGWISGVLLDDLGKTTPKVFNGEKGDFSDAKAVAMHCSLPKGKTASIGIVNLFSQGGGDTITFGGDGFSAADCFIGGKKTNLAGYIREKAVDTRLPLVADYCGAMVNVSIQSVKDKSVDFYAPVFAGVEYKFAAPVKNYVREFEDAVPKNVIPVFSCNCILNFLYSELEGKKTGAMAGPITFGEIAYQLLNQTLVYLEII